MEVEKLIAEVRSLTSEQNISAIQDVRDILPALNRAQKEAASIIARKYPALIRKPVYVTLEGGTSEYYIPANAYEKRITQADILVSGDTTKGNWRPMKFIDANDLGSYETDATNEYPDFLCLIGRKYKLTPVPATPKTMRLFIIEEPESLVLPYGRITSLSSTSVLLDQIRNSPSTSVEDLSAFVNIIDGITGRIKGTCQLSTIDVESERLTFSSSPTRTSVLGRTVTSFAEITEAALDDFICPIAGTCVVELPDPVPNFLTNWAREDVLGTLGATAKDMRRDFTNSVIDMAGTRPVQKRIKRVKSVWNIRGGRGGRW